jgi:hypothetical protein
LHLLTFAQTQEDLTYQTELEQIFTKVKLIYLPKWKSAANCLTGIWDNTPLQILYFKSAELQSELNLMLSDHKYDAVHVQHLRMSPYLASRKDIPRILDLPDAFSLYWERRKNVKRSLLLVNILLKKQITNGLADPLYIHSFIHYVKNVEEATLLVKTKV